MKPDDDRGGKAPSISAALFRQIELQKQLRDALEAEGITNDHRRARKYLQLIMGENATDKNPHSGVFLMYNYRKKKKS